MSLHFKVLASLNRLGEFIWRVGTIRRMCDKITSMVLK